MPYKFNPLPPQFDRVTDISSFVNGPGSSTDNALVRWDGASGTLIKDSNALLSDGGVLTLAVALPISSGGTAATTAAGARTNLGLGTMALQDSNNVSITGGSITGITDLAVADGGTGASSFTANGLLYGNTSSPLQSLSEAMNGYIPIGSTGNPPVLSTLTAGSGIDILNGPGSITISLTGQGIAIDTILTDDGAPAVGPDGTGQISILGGTGINVTGQSPGNTITVTLETPVPLSSGGTGATSLTDHGVLVGSGTSPIDALAVGTTGTLLVGSTGADPSFSSSATGDFTFTSSTAGATRTFTVSNTDNTNSASTALLQITTGGSSSGDPFQTYTVSGTTNWSTGIDNSVGGDPYVISASTALGTTNVMSMTTAGAVSCVLGNLDVTKSSSGADVSVTASNTSDTASSTATLYATTAGSSAGDAKVQLSTTTTTWTLGVDNSVTSPTADPFVISQGSALGTNNIMSVATSGEINYPLQPSFNAYLTSTATDATGDATVYTIASLTEVYDQNSDFNNTTGTFTAPVTGKYPCGFAITLGQVAAAHTALSTRLVSSNATYAPGMDCNPGAIQTSGFLTWSSSLTIDMDAADTFTVTIQVSGSTKVVDVLGGGRANTFTTMWAFLQA